MAQKFPNCAVLGIDLAPPPIPAESLPSNCAFEIQDVNLGLERFYNSFDLIQLRLIGGGVRSLFFCVLVPETNQL